MMTAAPAADSASPASDNAPPASDWVVHSAELDRGWKRTQEALAAIGTWAPGALARAYSGDDPMFYMFSGPDFLYAHAFFPNARTYILCGNEPVGPLPDLNKIPPNELPAALGNIRKSLGSMLSWSFFITENMKTDLAQPQLSGTVPLLYLFLARANCRIASVVPVTLDHNGVLAENGKGQTQGVRILFRNQATGSQQTLYYFCTDLSDDGIKTTPGLLRFCEKQGRGVSLLKAASYLMHEPGFSRIRQFLLERSDTLVQDDSGIPFRYFEPRTWDLQLCGPYSGPIEIFQKYWQEDLSTAHARHAAPPLPFGFGYQWTPNKSNLLVATRS